MAHDDVAQDGEIAARLGEIESLRQKVEGLQGDGQVWFTQSLSTYENTAQTPENKTKQFCRCTVVVLTVSPVCSVNMPSSSSFWLQTEIKWFCSNPSQHRRAEEGMHDAFTIYRQRVVTPSQYSPLASPKPPLKTPPKQNFIGLKGRHTTPRARCLVKNLVSHG